MDVLMDWLLFLSLILVGFVGCAEFGSLVFVHPVIRKLDAEYQLVFEKGLLETFGRFMPFGMTAATALGIALAIDRASSWYIAAAASLAVALMVTIVGNVPINSWTGRLSGKEIPEGFIAKRRKWDVFQAIRASLQLLGFLLMVAGAV